MRINHWSFFCFPISISKDGTHGKARIWNLNNLIMFQALLIYLQGIWILNPLPEVGHRVIWLICSIWYSEEQLDLYVGSNAICLPTIAWPSPSIGSLLLSPPHLPIVPLQLNQSTTSWPTFHATHPILHTSWFRSLWEFHFHQFLLPKDLRERFRYFNNFIANNCQIMTHLIRKEKLLKKKKKLIPLPSISLGFQRPVLAAGIPDKLFQQECHVWFHAFGKSTLPRVRNDQNFFL